MLSQCDGHPQRPLPFLPRAAMQLWELREELRDPAATKAHISQIVQRVLARNRGVEFPEDPT